MGEPLSVRKRHCDCDLPCKLRLQGISFPRKIGSGPLSHSFFDVMEYTQTLGNTHTWQNDTAILQRFVFPAYLAFSVCFYSLRFLFGWGSAETSTFESDMPFYLAVVKDIVWVGLLGAAVFSRDMERAVGQVRRHSAIYLVLAAFCAWMLLCSFLHLLFLYEPLNDSFMYHVRMPLEYTPAALLAPVFIGNWRQIGTTWKWLNWIAIVFAAFELVTVIGGWKQTAFGWGGVTTRFGGIFGSANDWGVYSGCAIVALLILGRSRAQLVGFVPGLILSQSRSALVGFIAAVIPILYRPDLRRILLRISALLLLAGFAVAFFLPAQSSDEFLPGHLGLDESALSRFDELNTFQQDFRNLDDVGALLFGVRYFHIEPFYLALVVRGGIPALACYVTAIGMSLARGWRLRRSSVLHLTALCVVILISTASLFIPYPDVYPTNFYLWLAVGVLWMEPESMVSV